jgi:hypothetical protein
MVVLTVLVVFALLPLAYIGLVVLLFTGKTFIGKGHDGCKPTGSD